MIQIDVKGCASFVNDAQIQYYTQKALAAFDTLAAGNGAGNDFLGWKHLPSETPAALVDDILAIRSDWESKGIDLVVAIGIGGSYLGAKCVNEALSHNFARQLKTRKAAEVVFAGNNLSEEYIAELLDLLKERNAACVVISKSGTTTEPAVAFRIVKKYLEDRYGRKEASERIVAVTDAKKGALKTLSTQEGYRSYVVPDNVGGRYSVLTPVGLLPILIAGFDIRAMLAGAADTREALKLRNADNPADAQKAIDFGAEGIGLFRIEHMFYGENSEKPLEKLRNMILADTKEERIAALDELEPYIRESAKGTLKVLDGKPLTFRLMDPPLHEFAPQGEEKMKEAAKRLGISYEDVRKRVESLHEVNPMMGLRGVRLGIIYSEITRVQFRALFSATCELMKEGFNPMLEIMVPLTINAAELRHQKAIATEVKEEVEKKYGVKFEYKFGTMIEIPRAALVANQIAEVAEFFSFGTNDLTQMTFGFSRDDVNAIVKTYVDEKIIPADPFNSFDQEGVGQLVKMGIERGRSTRANLKCGVCGEHGGDPTAAEFFYKAGMNYVSCSPFRVPVARLAAAQAAIKEAREK